MDQARQTGTNTVSLYVPGTQKHISVMQTWKTAVLYTGREIENSNWSVIVEGPLAPLQQVIYNSSIFNLAAAFLLLLVTNALSMWLSGILSQPVQQLAKLSASIPEKLESGQEVDWPQPATYETAALTENFRQTASQLKEKLAALKHSQEVLENKVIERTLELQNSNDKLRIIFENTIYAICLYDLENFRFLDVNQRFVQMYGYDRQELLSTVTMQNLTAEPDGTAAAVQTPKEQGMIFIPLRYHRKRDGTVFPVDIVGGTYENNRRIVFFMNHDVTARGNRKEARPLHP